MGWRGDLRDRYLVGLQAFAAANPTLVDHVYKARPASLTDAKCIFVGGVAENILHTQGTRQRTAEVTLVCTAALGENTETTDELEDMADGLVDYLTDNHGLIGAQTVQEPVRSTTTEVPDGGTFLPAIAVICRAPILQGRS